MPIGGTPAFLVLTGARAGPLHHWRWFKLRGLTKKERNKEIKARRTKYTWYVSLAVPRMKMKTGLFWYNFGILG